MLSKSVTSRRVFWLVVLVGAFSSSVVCGQTRELEIERLLRQSGSLAPRGLGGVVWMADSKSFTCIRRLEKGPVWMKFGVDDHAEQVLADPAGLDAAAKAAGVEGLPFQNLANGQWLEDGGYQVFDGRRLLVIRTEPLKLRVVAQLAAPAEHFALSRDARNIAFVRDDNIYVQKPDGTLTSVTSGGHADLTHGVAVSRVEFGIHDGLWWDPQGRRLAFYREDFSPVEPYPYIDWSKTPALHRRGRYPMAGRAGSRVSIGVFDTHSDSVCWLATDPTLDEYLTNVTWTPDGEKILVAHVNRDQNHMVLKSYSAADGRFVADLLSETDKEWVEPEHPAKFVPGGRGSFLWVSARKGFQHLYLHAASGNLLDELTPVAADVVEFLGFSADGRYFFCLVAGPDPRQRHVYRGSLEGPKADIKFSDPANVHSKFTPASFEQVTTGRGHHTAYVSPDGRYFVDIHSNLDLPQAADLVAVGRGVQRRIHEAVNPLQEFTRARSELFSVKTKDGVELYGHVYWPTNMQPDKKYPVLHYVYGGPHVQLVNDTWMLGPGLRNIWLEWMATRGFIVFRLDNRGTRNRGIEFEQVIHRRMGTLEVEDQILGLEWILQHANADRTRVGVHGWSYGGYMTLSLMTRAGEYYKAGVSGAPVTDWAFYETGYGERYMDRPQENADGYRLSRPAEHLSGLKGRLLLVHGSSDDTVVWQHTLGFVDECIRRGIDLDYMVYPGQVHGLSGPSSEHFFRKMTSFFERELR